MSQRGPDNWDMKWNEWGFRPPLWACRLNWTRRTCWGWWDEWYEQLGYCFYYLHDLSKYEVSGWWWCNVGPASQTVDQHYTNTSPLSGGNPVSGCLSCTQWLLSVFEQAWRAGSANQHILFHHSYLYKHSEKSGRVPFGSVMFKL